MTGHASAEGRLSHAHIRRSDTATGVVSKVLRSSAGPEEISRPLLNSPSSSSAPNTPVTRMPGITMNVPLAVAPRPASALGRRGHHGAQHCYSYLDDLPAAIWSVGRRRPAQREGTTVSVDPTDSVGASTGARVLVVGSRSHGVAGLLLGSVGSGWAEHAVCPVSVLHGTASPPPSRSEA